MHTSTSGRFSSILYSLARRKCFLIVLWRVRLSGVNSCTLQHQVGSLIQLQFYIVLTSQEKMFPHSTVESTALRSKSMYTSTSGKLTDSAPVLYCTHQPGENVSS